MATWHNDLHNNIMVISYYLSCTCTVIHSMIQLRGIARRSAKSYITVQLMARLLCKQ